MLIEFLEDTLNLGVNIDIIQDQIMISYTIDLDKFADTNCILCEFLETYFNTDNVSIEINDIENNIVYMDLIIA